MLIRLFVQSRFSLKNTVYEFLNMNIPKAWDKIFISWIKISFFTFGIYLSVLPLLLVHLKKKSCPINPEKTLIPQHVRICFILGMEHLTTTMIRKLSFRPDNSCTSEAPVNHYSYIRYSHTFGVCRSNTATTLTIPTHAHQGLTIYITRKYMSPG